MSGEERNRAHLDGVTAKTEIEQLPTHIKSSTQAESKSANIKKRGNHHDQHQDTF